MSINRCENDNNEIILNTIRKYSKDKKQEPVRNFSLNIKSENTVYTLIRLNDDQYYQLGKNSIAIFDDYFHIMSLHRNEELIYSSFSKMYTALRLLFGKSGRYYDDWKGSFSFPFLICFEKDGEAYEYLINLINLRSSIEFNFRKLVFPDDDRDRSVMHDPFEDFSRQEMAYVINFFVGYLSGFFEVISEKYDELFFHTVESNLILFGYDGTNFFDYQCDDGDEYRKNIESLEKKIAIQSGDSEE